MNVLVVDDQEDLRLLLCTILRVGGHQAVGASGGRRALEMLRAGAHPDVVLLDIQMPELDGWDTLAAIRGNSALRGVRVILCTVKAQARDVQRGWELGCDGYVTKPFATEALLEQIQAVARRGDSERRRVRVDMLERLAAETSPG